MDLITQNITFKKIIIINKLYYLCIFKNIGMHDLYIIIILITLITIIIYYINNN